MQVSYLLISHHGHSFSTRDLQCQLTKLTSATIRRTREQQRKKQIESKEKGFNIHINGANEDRIREQRKNEILRGNSQNNDNGSR